MHAHVRKTSSAPRTTGAGGLVGPPSTSSKLHNAYQLTLGLINYRNLGGTHHASSSSSFRLPRHLPRPYVRSRVRSTAALMTSAPSVSSAYCLHDAASHSASQAAVLSVTIMACSRGGGEGEMADTRLGMTLEIQKIQMMWRRTFGRWCA